MAHEIRVEDLIGRWVHSHEEDTATEMVFRPGDYSFPPSRGRRSFELLPDGSLVDEGIAPTDGPQRAAGSWKLEAEGALCFYRGAETQPYRRWRVVSLAKDRLTCTK